MVSLWLRGAALATLISLSGTHAWDADSIKASRKPIEASGPAIIQGKYIVELEPGTSLQSRDIGRRGSALIGEIESLGYDASVAEDLTSASGGFQAVSVEIKNDGNMTLGELKDVPGVVDAWPVYAITLDVEFDTNAASPKWNPHEVTRVEELHKRGIKGKGQRVCVVDSGADESHPVLSGRIAGGKNMLDDSTDIQDCNGHGTFVSSVIVGQSKDFVGVAPEAEVYMYKVFGCEGSTPNDIVLKGLLAADADDCDIVSLSLGLDNGYSGSVMSRVASEIAERRLVLIAAGNSGEQGVFYASSPASGRGVVSVASVNSKKVLGWPATLASSSGETLELRYVTPDGQKLNESTSVPIQFDEGDSCDPTLYGSEDEAVVIKRGICFSGKSYNFLTSQGFGYFLIFDSYNQGVFYDSEVTVNPEVHLYATTDASVGEWVKKQVASGRNLTLEVEADADAEVSEQDYPSAGQVSAFSSWGLTFENDFSPSIAAPGGAVYGAFPENDYAIASGTSFSTPYMAGIAALFFSSRKKDGEEFFRRIASTAALLPSYNAAMGEVVSEIASLAQQGAGLVDAVKLMDYETVLVSEPLISLNDTDNRIKTHTITLRNTGSESVTYKVSHVAAATVQSRDEYWYPMLYYPPLLKGEGSIEAPDSITIAAGATRDIQVTINAPEVDSDSGALWSGKIVFQGSNDEFVTVPYMGVEVSTYNWTPLEGAPLPFRYDSNDGFLYPINWKNLPYRPDELESPEIYYALRYGTYEFSLDLVGEDWTVDDFEYPFVAGASSNSWSGSVRSQPDVFGNYVNFPITFPVRFSNVGFTRFQSFSNGTAIPSGKYKILSRALRMFGNPNNAKDWQLFLSDAFSIQYGDDPIPGQTSTTAAATTESVTTSTVASLSETTTPSTTTSDVAAETTASVPGITTTLKAKSTPTGLANAFVDLSLTRQGSQSRIMNAPGDWMELHVQIRIPNRVPADTVVSFALPAEIVDVAEKEYVMDQGSNLVGTASFDEQTSVYSITLNDWTEWHKNMVGDFYLYCRFSKELQEDLQAGTYFIEIATVGEKFYPPVYYSAVDRTKVYEHQLEKTIDDRPIYEFDIEVPGQLGPWNSVALVASQASTDDGFLCDGTSVIIGTEFDHENKITKSRDITAEAVQRCQVKTFRSKYTGKVAEDEVLAFKIANMLGFKGSWTIDMSYSLAIELTNGTTVGFDVRTLQYALFSRSRPDNFFSGEVDRPGPVVSTTESTTESVSLTTMTPIQNTTTHVSTEATTTSFETTQTPTQAANTTFSTWSETTSETSSLVLPTTTDTSSVTSSVKSLDTTLTLTSGSSTVRPANETTTSSTTDYTTSSSSLESSETDISTSVSESTGASPTTTESDPGSTTTETVLTLETSRSDVSTSEPTHVYTTPTVSVPDASSSVSSLGSSQTGISTKSEHTYPAPSSPSQGSEGAPDSSSTSKTHYQPPGHTSLYPVTTSRKPGVVTETHAVTVITSVCSDPSWTAPVTVTYTVPCVTGDVESVTTVTSVCKKCAEHPVTITYTEPVQVTEYPASDKHPTSDVPLTRGDALHSASQIQYQGSSVTIPGPKQSQPVAGDDGKGQPEPTAPANVDASVVSTQVREVPTSTAASEGDRTAGNGEQGGSGGSPGSGSPGSGSQGSGQGGNQAPVATRSITTLSDAATEPPTSAPTMVVVEGSALRLGIDGWRISVGVFLLAFMLTI